MRTIIIVKEPCVFWVSLQATKPVQTEILVKRDTINQIIDGTNPTKRLPTIRSVPDNTGWSFRNMYLKTAIPSPTKVLRMLYPVTVTRGRMSLTTRRNWCVRKYQSIAAGYIQSRSVEKTILWAQSQLYIFVAYPTRSREYYLPVSNDANVSHPSRTDRDVWFCRYEWPTSPKSKHHDCFYLA